MAGFKMNTAEDDKNLIGMGDVYIFKEQLKHESFCVQRHYFDYHDIEFALNGKQPKMGNMYFTPKLIRVIQLE